MTDSNARRRKANRFTRMDDIRRDLMSGHITVRSTLEEIETRYGSDGWLQYKQVLRQVGYDHGCLVLADDENDGRFVAMMDHDGRDIPPEEVASFFSSHLAAYVARDQLPAEGSLGDNVVRLRPQKRRFSVYRLPCGDYSQETTAFFEERAEFLWEARV